MKLREDSETWKRICRTWYVYVWWDLAEDCLLRFRDAILYVFYCFFMSLTSPVLFYEILIYNKQKSQCCNHGKKSKDAEDTQKPLVE